jgi:hypothetical protein
MTWDIESFLGQLRGGFEAGQMKRDEQMNSSMESQKMEEEAKLSQYKEMKEKISVLQSLVKLFDSGKKKKNPDGTEVDEPNPVLELLKKSFGGVVGKGYDNPVSQVASQPQPNLMPQEYKPEPQPDPYMAPPKRTSVATNTNDIVGNIAEGGQDYLDSGDLEDYLKRYLNG